MILIFASRRRARALVHVQATEGTVALCGVKAGRRASSGIVGPTCRECRRIYKEGFRSAQSYIGETDGEGFIVRTPDRSAMADAVRAL